MDAVVAQPAEIYNPFWYNWYPRGSYIFLFKMGDEFYAAYHDGSDDFPFCDPTRGNMVAGKGPWLLIERETGEIIRHSDNSFPLVIFYKANKERVFAFVENPTPQPPK